MNQVEHQFKLVSGSFTIKAPGTWEDEDADKAMPMIEEAIEGAMALLTYSLGKIDSQLTVEWTT